MTDHLIARFAQLSSSPASSAASPPRNSNSTVATGEVGKGLMTGECAFCDIVAGRTPAHKVYEDQHVVAVLDILPIRPGHLLLLPKAHYQRIDVLPDQVAAHLGSVLPQLGRALCRATGNPDWNLVSNQGYAQIVPHVHYHLVPAPILATSSSSPNTAPPSSPSIGSRRQPGSLLRREELDEEEGEKLASRIRAEIAREGQIRMKL